MAVWRAGGGRQQSRRHWGWRGCEGMKRREQAARAKSAQAGMTTPDCDRAQAGRRGYGIFQYGGGIGLRSRGVHESSCTLTGAASRRVGQRTAGSKVCYGSLLQRPRLHSPLAALARVRSAVTGRLRLATSARLASIPEDSAMGVTRQQPCSVIAAWRADEWQPANSLSWLLSTWQYGCPWPLIAGDQRLQKPIVCRWSLCLCRHQAGPRRALGRSGAAAVRLPEGDLTTHGDVRNIRLPARLARPRLFADGVQPFHSPMERQREGCSSPRMALDTTAALNTHTWTHLKPLSRSRCRSGRARAR